MRYVKDHDNAQDAMMEGFMKVFDHLHDFVWQGDGALEAWMRKIMINECLVKLRKDRSRFYMDIIDHDSATHESVEGDLAAEEIMELINRLPAGYRTVFNLFAIDGYSHMEIAAALGISESASRSQLTHARSKLKEMLTKHGWK
jgi:RNA polymerase sigma-70 factor (ECF subfamily)